VVEQLLKAEAAAFVVVSHDRWFLENVAERMLDLDPSTPPASSKRVAATATSSNARTRRCASRPRIRLRWQTVCAASRMAKARPKARSTKSQARIDEAGRLIDELADVSTRWTAAAPR